MKDLKYKVGSLVILVLVALGIHYMINIDKYAIEDLKEAGYTDIRMNGQSWNWKCGKVSQLNRKFTARKNGVAVTGIICKTSFDQIYEDKD